MNSHVDLPSAAVQEYWNTKAAPRFSLLDRLSLQGCAEQLTAARHAIDDELSALQMVMCAMRTRRNDFSLIGRLPPEILSHIFSLHAIKNQPNPFWLGWITVTHVCRRWRQVALSDPNLWSTVVFDLGAEGTEEMLARSKAALISYCRDLSFQPGGSRTRRWRDDENALRKHLSHVRRLVLAGDPGSLTPPVRALTTPAPHLESLELLCYGAQFRDSCITISSNLFAHAPKLRHVTLSGCAVPWDDSPLFLCDLTRLDISFPPALPFPHSPPVAQSDPLSIPTLERLLSILEAMPSLQELTLGNCLPPAGSSSRVVPVHLRHMSKLSLSGSLSEVVAVLGRVSSPSSASLSLRCPDHNPSDGLLDTLVSLLASHFRDPEAPISPLSTVVIDGADCGLSLSIMVWDTDDVPLHQLRSKPPAPARLDLTIGSQYEALAQSLPLQVCKALPLQDLQTLSLTYPNATWSAAGWVNVYSHFPKVTHLLVRVNWAITLFPTLTQRNDAFPSLVTLGLQNMDFGYSPPEHSEPLGEVFLVTLRARSNAGIPIRRVTLRSCVRAGRWTEPFSEVVHDLTWEPYATSGSDSQSSSCAPEHDYDYYNSWSDRDSDDSDEYE